MRILHYGLGYPPNRSGGLVYYTIDLMKEQVSQGHEVGYLYPGKTDLLNKNVRIKKHKPENTGIISYELINSLPLPLFGGIKNPVDFMITVEKDIYIVLLNEYNPDVIHIHSLMGIHKEFFEVAKKLGIKIVFTSHDYFGLSPNPTFYFNSESWDEQNTLNYWLNVSQIAMSTKKLRLFQLPYYSKIKDIYKKFKKSGAQQEKETEIKNNCDFSSELIVNFEKLRKYYLDIFDFIDTFHFNSSVAQRVFDNNLKDLNYFGKILLISNSSIIGGTKEIIVDFKDIKKITYIGPYAKFKGFDDFLELAKMLEDKDYEFEVYGEDADVELPANVINRGRFSIEDRKNVFRNIELLLLPSNCKETFGFLAIEALDSKVPVMISSNVGAKDTLSEDFIFDNIEEVVKKLSISYVLEFGVEIDTIKEHTKKINSLIYS